MAFGFILLACCYSFAHLHLVLDLLKQRLELLHVRRLRGPADAQALGLVGLRNLYTCNSIVSNCLNVWLVLSSNFCMHIRVHVQCGSGIGTKGGRENGRDGEVGRTMWK